MHPYLILIFKGYGSQGADACDEPAYRPCAVRSAEALCGAAWRALDAKGFVYRAGQQLFP